MGNINEESGIDETFGDDREGMWGSDLPESNDDGELTAEATLIILEDIAGDTSTES